MKMRVDGKDIFQIIRWDVIILKRVHMRKELLNSMCNLSQGIKERALEQGLNRDWHKDESWKCFLLFRLVIMTLHVERRNSIFLLRSLRRKWLLRDIVCRSKTKYLFDG